MAPAIMAKDNFWFFNNELKSIANEGCIIYNFNRNKATIEREKLATN